MLKTVAVSFIGGAMTLGLSIGQASASGDMGYYLAKLKPLNTAVAGKSFGIAKFSINKFFFKAKVTMVKSPGSTLHAQHIHAGAACPTMAADANGDGVVDVVEGVPDYGPILIPLDGDLSSQAAGAMTFPTANAAGRYVYMETASFADLISDLRAPDPDPSDVVIKLEEGEDLDLDGRHVVIHGVPEDTDLPATVATIPGLPANVTLPIACGEIVRKHY